MPTATNLILENLKFWTDSRFIENGECQNRTECALALSLKHRLEFYNVKAGQIYPDASIEVGNKLIMVKLTGDRDENPYCIAMEEPIQRWIKSWDRGEAVNELLIQIKKTEDVFGLAWEAHIIAKRDALISKKPVKKILYDFVMMAPYINRRFKAKSITGAKGYAARVSGEKGKWILANGHTFQKGACYLLIPPELRNRIQGET